jgi:hypothetical protein
MLGTELRPVSQDGRVLLPLPEARLSSFMIGGAMDDDGISKIQKLRGRDTWSGTWVLAMNESREKLWV